MAGLLCFPFSLFSLFPVLLFTSFLTSPVAFVFIFFFKFFCLSPFCRERCWDLPAFLLHEVQSYWKTLTFSSDAPTMDDLVLLDVVCTLRLESCPEPYQEGVMFP